ncbi:MAG: AAA family ATPase [Oscillatoria sp. SIO1A7]|nr:AAA family ATPase [Oscillatoria sp. SIO1A7]
MLNLAGYQEKNLLYSGTRTLVYRAVRATDTRSVIIKVLRNPHPNFNELVQFRNQYVITRHLKHPHIIRPIALERYGNGYALVMPDSGAIALNNYWQNSERNLAEFLEIGIQLSVALHYLSGQRIIHKDVKPANIIIHPESRQVKLIDFSIASLLPKEQQQLINPNVLEGTLAYISPEQTGRMNRGIDYRTDFYSLGVTFFEMLTGSLPCVSSDPMELIHCHIAKMPPPLGNGELGMGLGREIPEVIEKIILKLMAKNAEERYQSALGLKQDLEICLQELEGTGVITNFEIGERDACDRFLIPEKLYGRSREVKKLLDAFERVAGGTAEMMLVAGFSGIGKTAVVNEVHKPIVQQRGYFIKGKFDQLNRNIPFSAFVQAFRDLLEQLLVSSDAELAVWKGKILAALGENGQVIIEVIPELEKLIGKQAPMPELEGSAAQNRFNLMFGKFIGVFTTKEHPLTIFMDDLQWADLASLNLLKLLMDSSEAGYLLLLGAYRDNEVFPGHPLMLSLEEIEKQGAIINTLTLAGLGEIEITDLVADTLLCPAPLASPLANLVYQKTRGNPFFTTQFLKGLYEDGWIVFDGDAGYWQCDMAQVRQIALTDDVVEFMMGRLQKLSKETQEVLKMAGCIGNEFNLETLAIVTEKSPEETAVDLWPALAEGLILPETEIYKFYLDSSKTDIKYKPENTLYKFLHDRVQQAAYSLIDEEKRKETQLEIGRRLWANIEEEGEDIFEIVDRLNIGEKLISDRSERDEIGRLNLLAAQKAKTTTAYAAALDYANAGLSLLAEDSWSSKYELTLALYIEKIEAEYLNTNFEAVESLAKIIIENTHNILDRVKVYEVLIRTYIGQGKMQEVVDLGLQVLEILEISLSEDPRDRIEDLQKIIDLPEMSDPYKLAAMNILANIITSAWVANPQLFKVLTFTMVDLSLQYGNCASSAFGYSWYSMFFCEGLGDIEFGYKFGELSVRLVERLNAIEIKSKVLNIFAGTIMLWKQHLRGCIEVELEGIQSGLISGDFEFACYCAAEYCHYLFMMGKELDIVRDKFQQYQQTIQRLKQDYHLDYMASWQQAIRNLQGKSANCTQVFSEDTRQEVSCLEKLVEEEQAMLVYNAYLLKTFLSNIFKDYEAAVENAKFVIKYSPENGTHLFLPAATFYASLALIAGYRQANSEEKEEYLTQVSANLVQMQHWAKYAPMNYEHQCDIIRAEIARSLGKKWEAVEYYKRARAGAKENEYLHHEALSCELTAEFYLEQEMPEIAQIYLADAYYAYARWGAKAKVEDLEQRYRQLLAPVLKKEKTNISANRTVSQMVSTNVTSSSSRASHTLDFSSAIKSAQAISVKVDLEDLLSKLMQALMENAGATKGALLLPKEGTLFVEVMANYTEEAGSIRISLRRSQPLSSHKELPISIINTVWRTRETMLLNDAIAESRFASDAYLIRCLPKSLLCMPLLNQGKSIAILYLDNNLTTGAFTSDRLEILNIISTQAAISIENARLYSRLERYSYDLEVQVKQRTQELQEKNLDLQDTLLELQRTQAQLIQTEKMSSLGQMVAGIAHEINNPITFISGNISHAREYVADLIDLLELYEKDYPNPSTAIQDKLEELNLDFVCSDLAKLLDSMQNGSDRIRNIILGLRNFSRLDEADLKPVDIHEGLENTLTILQHRLETRSEIERIAIVKNYALLPLIHCYANQLNQVFLNILTNAIDVLSSSEARSSREIRIATQMRDAQTVRIRIADNGPGMRERVRQKVFDPFFTTKPVGQGTGLGLSISYQIVTEQHGGQLHCISEPGVGTEFVIEIPI